MAAGRRQGRSRLTKRRAWAATAARRPAPRDAALPHRRLRRIRHRHSGANFIEGAVPAAPSRSALSGPLEPGLHRTPTTTPPTSRTGALLRATAPPPPHTCDGVAPTPRRRSPRRARRTGPPSVDGQLRTSPSTSANRSPRLSSLVHDLLRRRAARMPPWPARVSTSFTIDPTGDFTSGETCTVTILASGVRTTTGSRPRTWRPTTCSRSASARRPTPLRPWSARLRLRTQRTSTRAPT